MTDIRRPSREELLELKGQTLRLPELLEMFGVRVRNYRTVPVISEALREAGLATHPSFTTCGLATPMLVVTQDAAPSTDDEGDDEIQPGTLPQQSFKIGDIPSASAGVDSVRSTAPLSAATYTMRLKNYSQLPVIDDMSDLKGVLTWSSIAAQYEKGGTPTLANSTVKDSIPVVEVHQELFARLPELQQYGYLLVRSNSGSIVGIITGADITRRFHTLAFPFFLVGEIEFRLRMCLGSKLTGDPIKLVQRKNHQTGNVSDLMFGDYVRLLNGEQQGVQLRQQADENWKALSWGGVDRAQFVAHLDRVRSIRNQIAHFDDQPLSDLQINELIQFSGLLKQLL